MTWLAVLRLLLQVASKIAGIVSNKQLMNAGEDRAIAKSLAIIQVSLGIADEVEADISRMTARQVDDALEEDFRD